MANRARAFARVAACAVALGGLPDCVRGSQEPAPVAPGPPAATLDGTRAPAPDRSEVQVGKATWYGAALAGRRTASGERFDPERLTAAHRTLPLGTWVEVTRLDTGQSVRVRINDRGPFGNADRIIDLSHAAAAQIGLLRVGVAPVEVRAIPGP